MSEDVRKENPKLQGNGWVSKQKRKQRRQRHPYILPKQRGLEKNTNCLNTGCK